MCIPAPLHATCCSVLSRTGNQCMWEYYCSCLSKNTFITHLVWQVHSFLCVEQLLLYCYYNWLQYVLTGTINFALLLTLWCILLFFVGWRVIERNVHYLKGVDLQLNCVMKTACEGKDHKVNVLLQNLLKSASEFMFWPCLTYCKGVSWNLLFSCLCLM